MKFNSFAKLAGVAAALTLSAFPINAFAAGGHGAAGKTGPHGAPEADIHDAQAPPASPLAFEALLFVSKTCAPWRCSDP